jgi:hypothetical protein
VAEIASDIGGCTMGALGAALAATIAEPAARVLAYVDALADAGRVPRAEEPATNAAAVALLLGLTAVSDPAAAAAAVERFAGLPFARVVEYTARDEALTLPFDDGLLVRLGVTFGAVLEKTVEAYRLVLGDAEDERTGLTFLGVSPAPGPAAAVLRFWGRDQAGTRAYGYVFGEPGALSDGPPTRILAAVSIPAAVFPPIAAALNGEGGRC